MRISVSDNDEKMYFRDLELTNMNQMVDVLLKRNFSPSTYKNGHRTLANFQEAYCIGMDVDNDGKTVQKQQVPFMTIDEAKEAFKDYRHLILPSRSHRKEKHGKVADRFRVILFFSEAITDIETMYATWFWCKAKWPAIDPQCKDPSRFYFKHSSVYSVQSKGLLIDPVAPAPVVPHEAVDLSRLLPGDRGRLSKETLKNLEEGIEPGGRNGAVFKMAKDMQQNLFSHEEALEIILSKLNENGTITKDFPESEVKSAVKSAYGSEPKHEPRIEERAFKMVRIGELYKQDKKVEWRVERLLAGGGISLIAAAPKVGKSTIVRQLIRDVLKGEQFLGRSCTKGSVLYFAMEEQEEVLQSCFKNLGVGPEEELFIHVGRAEGPNSFRDFKEIILHTKPNLCVIDTLFGFIKVASENNYTEVGNGLEEMRELARQSGTHICFIHHANKGSSDDRGGLRGTKSILGSSAIAGAMDTNIVIEVKGGIRYISSEGRGIIPWQFQALKYDNKTDTYSIGAMPKPQDEDEF